MPSLETLRESFAIADHVTFEYGPGDLIFAQVDNAHASARLALYGAHVTAYQPKGQAPVIFTSQASRYEAGAAIRGGIPICWPWFAAHPSDSGKPSHGFARITPWTLAETQALPNGATQLRFDLSDNADSRALWPHAFGLSYTVTVGNSLMVDLAIHNREAEAITYTGALHSYFHVGDVRQIHIEGLDGLDYLDKVRGMNRFTQAGVVRFDQEVDRIYLSTTAETVLHDPVLERTVHVAKRGSHSTVVWNPWAEKSQAMADMMDAGYVSMVCIETANAAENAVNIPAGDTAHLGAEIWLA